MLKTPWDIQGVFVLNFISKGGFSLRMGGAESALFFNYRGRLVE